MTEKLRDRLIDVVEWARRLAQGEARARRAAGDHAGSRAAFRVARELRRRSPEVVPHVNASWWLGPKCLTCMQWWPVVSCGDAERGAVEALADKVSPPSIEGAVLDRHLCRQGPYVWEWRPCPATQVHLGPAGPAAPESY